MQVQVAEIFESISGEIGLFRQGSPTTFIRFSGCNMVCPFCDTPRTQDPQFGESLDIDHVVARALAYPWIQVIITGGEPLAQPEAFQALVDKLKKRNNMVKIQVETNGSLSFEGFYDVDSWVIDLKHRSSLGEAYDKYKFAPLPDRPFKNVYIKHVVANEDDLKRALWTISLWRTDPRGRVPYQAVSFLASYPDKAQGVAQVLKSKMPISINFQLHKLLGVA